MFKITSGKGFQITFPNGYTASVQFGWGNYCSSTQTFQEYATFKKVVESPDAEIAAWDINYKWLKLTEHDNVLGRQSPEEVLKFLNEIAALPAVEKTPEQ